MELQPRFACNLGMSIRLVRPPVAVAIALLAGCASSPLPPAGGPAASPTAAPATPPAVSLSDEQHRLAELFRGTPVVFEMTPEGRLRVEVPEKFCFDKGRAVVKAPLAKVLDYVATTARSPGMTTRVRAPADASGGSSLARQRAESTRDYLIAKGVPFGRFMQVAPSDDDVTEIVVGRS
jgi:outer membrane protein OmpA-like peptidoglycan-associated protein